MSDVVVIGGGPAGLTLGCDLANAGVGCAALERANHPLQDELMEFPVR